MIRPTVKQLEDCIFDWRQKSAEIQYEYPLASDSYDTCADELEELIHPLKPSTRSYFLVESHVGTDYWVKVDRSEPDQDQSIEARCEMCGDHDRIIGIASTVEEARTLCNKNYKPSFAMAKLMVDAFKKAIDEDKDGAK